jgi:hypothetical protein
VYAKTIQKQSGRESFFGRRAAVGGRADRGTPVEFTTLILYFNISHLAGINGISISISRVL